MRLTEMKSSQSFFHVIQMDHLVQALNRGGFELGIASQVDDDHQKNRPYYLSMARSGQARYFRGRNRGSVVEFNGDWLRQRYKVLPVDYWHAASADTEQEERLISTKPMLPIPPDAHVMIKAIHLIVPPGDHSEYGMGQDRAVVMAAHRRNIPVRYYQDGKRLGVPGGDVPLSTVKADLSATRKDKPDYWFRKRKRELAPYRELLFKQKYEELSPEAQRLTRLINRFGNPLLSAFDADLHNMRSMDRPEAHRMVEIMRQHGITSTRDFAAKMSEKWEHR